MNYQEKDNLIDIESILQHDTVIHSVGFNPTEYKLMLDIDWIIERNIENSNFSYLLSPSTLIFENVWDIQFDIGPSLGMTIDSVKILSRTLPKNNRCLCHETYEYLLSIECMEGTIQFRTIGGKLFQRESPIIKGNSSFTIDDRSNFSLLPIGKIFGINIKNKD